MNKTKNKGMNEYLLVALLCAVSGLIAGLFVHAGTAFVCALTTFAMVIIARAVLCQTKVRS